MRRTVTIVHLLTLLILVTSSLHAEDSWKIVANSPGMIEKAVVNPDGGIFVLEQLRATRSLADGSSSRALEFAASERIFVSSGGTKYASILYEGKGEVPSAAKLSLFSANDEIIWAIDHHSLNDVVPLETGGAIGVLRNINLLENTVYFINETGTLVKEHSIPALGEIKASRTGDRILINSGKNGAMLYRSNGEVISKLGSSYRMFFSPDGRWEVTLYGPKLTIFHEGIPTYVGELGGEIIRGAVFSQDNARLAAFTDHAFFIMQNPGGRILLQRQLDPAGELSFTSIDITDHAKLIALGVERDLGPAIKGPERHPDGEVRLYNLSGDLLYHKQVAYSRWNTTTPRVKFSADNTELIVLTRDEVIRAEISDLSAKGGAR